MNLCPCCRQPLPALDEISVNMTGNVLLYNGQCLKITRQEADLLEILVRRRPNTVLYDTIISGLWGLAEPQDAQNCLKVRITMLRKKLAPIGLGIKTEWGRGLRLDTLRDASGMSVPAEAA